LREAEATFADAQREYNRVKDLSTTAIPKAQKDQRLARFLEAKARLAAASARLKDYAIIAPFDGVLGLRNVSPGSLVQPGDVVTTIAKVDKIKVDATLPEAALSKIELGMSIKATTPARPGKEFIGT